MLALRTERDVEFCGSEPFFKVNLDFKRRFGGPGN